MLLKIFQAVETAKAIQASVSPQSLEIDFKSLDEAYNWVKGQ